MEINLTSKHGFSLSPSLYAFIAVTCSVVFMLLIVNPLWSYLDLHVPGEPEVQVDFTQPVDSIFYVRNAEIGYRWGATNETSIWFHPVVVWLMNLLPSFIEANVRLWIVSIASALGAILAIHHYLSQISPLKTSARLILFVPLLPGGLGIATGNAEFTCLLFCTLLISSTIGRWPAYHPLLWGTLAILTKPNALYMLPCLVIYLLSALRQRDFVLARNSLFGCLTIGIVWVIWIFFVDIQSNQLGAYWAAREVSTLPLSAGPLTFLQRTARVLVHSADNGEKLKFITALAIPLIHIVLLLFIRLRNELHRLSILLGILLMVLMMFATNNPNKIIVYGTTFPGFIAIGILFLKQCFETDTTARVNQLERFVRFGAGLGYLSFCMSLGIFYILGTVFGWYY